MLCIRGRLFYWLCMSMPDPPPPPPPPPISHDCETPLRQSCNSFTKKKHKHCQYCSRKELIVPHTPQPPLTHPHTGSSGRASACGALFEYSSPWTVCGMIWLMLCMWLVHAMHVQLQVHACYKLRIHLIFIEISSGRRQVHACHMLFIANG